MCPVWSKVLCTTWREVRCDDVVRDTMMRFSLKLFGLEPRVCLESERVNVVVTTWTIVTEVWDTHADNMRMRKTCARQVLFVHSLSVARRLNFRQAKKSFIWKDPKNHCSLQDEDFHESQFHVDHNSLLGCHRYDEDEDDGVVEE